MHGRDHRPGGTDPIPGLRNGAWAILAGTEFDVDGTPSSTLPASTSAQVIFTSFVTGGDLGVFATHNSGTRPSYPIPDPSGFHNSSGDQWVYAVKTGVLVYNLDIGFEGGPTTFPISVVRDDGDSIYQGGEAFGPQCWKYTPDSSGIIFSWFSIRPIDNDPSDMADEGGQGLYYGFSLNVQNEDSSDHTILSGVNIELQIGWFPVEPGQLNTYY